MKNVDKMNRLQIMLNSEMLKFNVGLQNIIEEFKKDTTKLKERDRVEELKKVLAEENQELTDDNKDELLDKIAELEDIVIETLEIDSKKIELQELLEISDIIADYKKAKLHADLLNEIVDELEEEVTDKDIYVYDLYSREYLKLKYDERYYFLLSKLNLVKRDTEILYMKDFRIYDSLLHYMFDENYETFIIRKNDDLLDIRKENFDFIPLGLVKAKEQIDESLEILRNTDSDELSKALEYAIEEEAQKVIDDLDDILGEGWEDNLEEMLEGDDWDE